MRRFEQFDDKKDFWETFPELLNYPVLEELSDLHEDSSTIMWMIHKCEHPKSTLYRDPNKYSLPSIKKVLDPVDKKLKAACIDVYKNACLTLGEMQLVRWKATTDSLLAYVQNRDYSEFKPAEVDKFGGILDKIQKMYVTYDKIMEQISNEETAVEGKKSLSEQRLI